MTSLLTPLTPSSHKPKPVLWTASAKRDVDPTSQDVLGARLVPGRELLVHTPDHHAVQIVGEVVGVPDAGTDSQDDHGQGELAWRYGSSAAGVPVRPSTRPGAVAPFSTACFTQSVGGGVGVPIRLPLRRSRRLPLCHRQSAAYAPRLRGPRRPRG